MNCRLCETKLTPSNKCNARIFPASLLRILSPQEFGSLKLVGTEMERAKPAPIGSYDGTILCATCDNKLGVYDGYAKVFVQLKSLTPHPSGLGWTIQHVNQHKLKMFCLSYLWRASITRRPEFDGVSLGEKHENKIREMILSDNSGTVNDYTTSLQRFSNKDNNFGGILFPARTKIEGLTCYEGYLPRGYKFWVKVDSRNEKTLSPLSVGATEPLFVGDRGDFHRSKEKAIMVRAARRSN